MFEVPAFAELGLGAALPAIVLAVCATILLLVDLFIPRERKIATAIMALIYVGMTFVINFFTFNANTTSFLGLFAADHFTGILNMIVLFTAFISILLSIDYIKRTGMERGEYYTLLLLSVSGTMFMGAANDLVMIFIALELLSIPLYVMAAFRAPDLKSEESGLKYFILGAFSSAFFVYGAALVYGATGSTNLPTIFQQVNVIVAEGGSSSWLLLIGTGLILVGLGFKVAVAPFHMWTPDVYEGAPTPVTAFMSVGAKIGGFAALLRIMVVALPTFALTAGAANTAWQVTFWVIAAITLVWGNIVAVAQTSIKRMLAYSSIAHAGYIMMAVAAAGTAGVANNAAQAALIYLMAYMFTNLGAFGVAMVLERNDGTTVTLDDFTGLSKHRPILALMMAVFMLSLTGIPLTGGFVGKFFVFSATVEAGLIPLAIIGVLTSVASAYYYVRVIINMYLKDGEPKHVEETTPALTLGLYVAFVGTLILGIFPFLITGLTDTVQLASR
jgi:NADH-quinone oxidoreductase subunit N